MAHKQQRFIAEQKHRGRSSSLSAFTLDEVDDVGKEIGSGSYGVVIELEFRGKWIRRLDYGGSQLAKRTCTCVRCVTHLRPLQLGFTGQFLATLGR